MAMVDSVVTATMVNSTSRSDLSLPGITAASASAAEAPQIATAPPVRMANRQPRENSFAQRKPKPMVSAIRPATVINPEAPMLVMSPSVMRAPKSTMPSRSSDLEAKTTPSDVRSWSAMKLNAMPIKSANSMAGAA